jgi:hypothetical protein
MFGIDQSDSFPGWWALLPTIGAALVIAAGEAAWSNRYILSCKPAVFVGLISYPLYLWHWPILSFLKIASVPWGFKISPLLKGAVIVLSFVLAYLTYCFIELPIRHVKQRSQRRKGALWLLGCVSLTGAFGVLVLLTGGFPSRLPSAIVAFDHDYGADAERAWRYGTCFLRPDQSAASFSESCVDAPEGNAAQPLVLVWGDSHAADLLPGFRSLQPQSGVRLAQYTASLCAPLVGMQIRERPACHSVNDAVIGYIRVLKPEIVVLSASWDLSHVDLDRVPRAEKLQQTIGLVKAAGVRRVVVIGSAPIWIEEVPAILIDGLQRNPNSPAPDRWPRSFLADYDDSLLRATTLKAGAAYVPLFEDLCDQASCIATTGPGWQNVVIFDHTHFTEHGSIMVAQRIWATVIHAGN